MSNPILNTADIVLPLHTPDATLALVGGKGLNLARLAQSGFAVPGGFLVATQAYRTYVAANHMRAWILDVAQRARVDDPAALEAASAAIRARFAEGVMPETIRQALTAAYAALGQPAVAVRSSATAEDLPDLSFAGQQDTFLNVTGEAALLRAIVDCWSSLWTARAIGYRSRNQIAHDEVALAVVVQQMVESEAAGVLFTANPLTGNRSETVIDATLGLGEALVSGQVEPDQYVVQTATARILSKTLGAKALAIRSRPGGGTTTVYDGAAQQQALPDAAIKELAALGRDVAALYGSPQDIEWAWAGGKLHLLQARPITSLFPTPAGAQADPLEVFVSLGAVQGVLDPLTPLGRDGLALMIGCGIAGGFGLQRTVQTQTLLLAAGERLWARVTPLLQNRIGRKIAHAAVGLADPHVKQAIGQLLAEPAWAVAGWPQPTTLRHIAYFFRRLLPLVAASLLWPDDSRRRFQQDFARAFEQFADQARHATSLAARLAFFETELPRYVATFFPRAIGRLLPGMLMLNRLLALANRAWADDEAQRQRALEMTRGLPHNVTTEMDLALWATAQAIRENVEAVTHFQRFDAAALAQQYLADQLPPAAQRAIHAFLTHYGVRGVAEIDLGRPRWREYPAQMMQTIQSYLRIDDPAQAPDAVFRRGESVAQGVIDDLRATLRRQPGGRLKAALVGWMATRYRALAGLRESPKFFFIQMLGIVREGLLQSGADLAAQGIIEQPDDLFYLHLDELKGLAAGYAIPWQALVAERRALYDREKLRRQIPRLLLSDGRAIYDGFQSTGPQRDGVLTGTPVSPGVVEGVVHVVFDPHAAQLAPGEILVCPGTDPAWTPLFLAAGGLVMEVGGLMTHGSVVAREYGIPAVVGVHNVTSRLQSGQRVRVDGSTGEVAVLAG